LKDFEIILMDNSDGNDTAEAVSMFKDPRLRYYRSGGLNMSENWENALEKTTGQYITVLEDKHAYYSFALMTIKELIIRSNAEVVIFDWDHYDSQNSMAYRKKYSRTASFIASDRLIKKYINKVRDTGTLLPRMINSFASVDLIKRIKKQPKVDRFFSEFSPDLCASFFLLSVADRILILNDGIGLGGYSNLSNAHRIRSNDDSYNYYGDIDRSKLLNRLRIKSNLLTYNAVYGDYLFVRNIMGLNLDKYIMSNMIYVKVCLWDVIRLYASSRSVKRIFPQLLLIFDFTKKEKFSIFKYLGLFSIMLDVFLVVFLKLYNVLIASKWPAENIYVAAMKAGVKPPRIKQIENY